MGFFIFTAMSIKTMPVWKWVLLLIAGFVLALFYYGLAQTAFESVQPAWLKILVAVGLSVGMLLLYAFFVRWFEKKPAPDIPPRRIVPDTAQGLGYGAGFMLAVTLVMMLFGFYKVAEVHQDVALPLVTAFMRFLMVAVCEEVLFRGILFRWIDEKWGFPIALVVSAILFGLVHIAQPGATWWSSLAIAIEAGLLLGAAYKYAGNLWLPIGIHWAWNFVQGNIFGFEVSGGDAGDSLLKATVEGPDILTGGVFGAEASIITVVLGLALSVWFIVRCSKKA